MKVLVIGASGGFGGAVARELVASGAEVRALARPGGRIPAIDGASVVYGDALDPAALADAADGVDAIVFGFHVPYPDWDPIALKAAAITADVAVAAGATVLFPGNVYNLDPDFAGPIPEDAPHRPPTELGAIRQRMEVLFEDATRRGARVIVLRAGDYFGPHLANTWFELLTRGTRTAGRILDPAPAGVPHAWAYLPDVARAGVRLLERRGELQPFDVFHFSGYALDSRAFTAAVRRALGDPRRKVWRFPWWLLTLAAPFSPLLRRVRWMRYLWQRPIVLDGSKLRARLPDFTPTPLDTAVHRVLSGAGEPSGAPELDSAVNATS